MVTRKPLPPQVADPERGPSFSMPTSSSNLEESTIPTTTDHKPLYSYTEESSQAINPWEDVERPVAASPSARSWDIPKAIDESGTTPDFSKPELGTKVSDVQTGFYAQEGQKIRQLTPQSSWERDSDSSEEDIPPKPTTSTAPAHAPPPPPPLAQASIPRPVDTNPYRAKISEQVPRVPVSKEEDSTNIWAEIAQDTIPPPSQPAPAAELERLVIEDKKGWNSEQQAQAGPFISPSSPLIDLDQSNDYRSELEATPFAPPEGLENLGHGRASGKGKLPIQSGGEEFAPPEGPPPSAQTPKFIDRKISVPTEVANKQRSETYQIKHIRWADSKSHEIRVSPILIQNKNGPCPLMALVNALTLSTPPALETALIETLRTREQISLGLLIDAVFDELMSGRRGDAAQELPDVSELYSFLITLHTGMNVNPRFVPVKRQTPNLIDASYEGAPVSEEDHPQPGSFEYTKEMMLYGTFSVPLIHGWLPPKSHPAFPSIERSAMTYEDAQNLMFREEELEDKIQSSGLSSQEQQLLEDVSSVKYFLNSTATQLTDYGLETIHEALPPGSIAIFFRNDHFNTMYKHPRSGQLLLLVTDAGYSTHDEVVWQSLVDIGGKGSEFFSGDFRPVGGPPSQSQAFEQPGTQDSAWTTVPKGKRPNAASNRNQTAGNASSNPFDALPPSPSGRDHEQEDADLALALQLQEEEEENSRRAAAQRRQREEEASSQFLAQNTNASDSGTTPSAENRRRSRGTSGLPQSQQSQPQQQPASQNVQPLLPPRRTTTQTTSRPAVRRDTNGNDDEIPPPTYDEAAKSEPYTGPPITHTATSSSTNQDSRSAASNQSPGYTRRSRGQSAYSANNAQGVFPMSPETVRRRSGVSSEQDPPIGVTRRTYSASENNKDCIVM